MKKSTVGYFVILSGLVLGLTGCSPRTPSDAIQAWKAKGRSDKILKLLHDPLQSVRVEAIDALAEMKAKDAVEPLGLLFNDPDLIVVHEAVDAVAEIGGPEIEHLMLQAVNMETVPARVTGATALGNFKSDKAVDALIIALDDYKYEQIVLAAITSLGQIGNPRAIDPLRKKLQERSYAVREACIQALRRIGGEASLEAIATRLGDINQTIRGAAVDALLEGGKTSAPFVLEALRSEKREARADALTLLKGIEAVPTAGSDLVWYRLAELTVEEQITVDPDKAVVFGGIDNRIQGLLEGLVHASPEVREYASIALEDMGNEAVEAAVALADEKATQQASEWFGRRSGWSGAPSWRLDLWGAVATVSPNFQVNRSYVELLTAGGTKAVKVMTAEQFRPLREIIPYLLTQLAPTESSDPDVKEQAERCRTLAMQHLQDAGHRAVFPLMAALNGADNGIAVNSARVLNRLGGARIEQMVIDEYFKRFEFGGASEQVDSSDSEEAAEADPGLNPLVELSGTPFHNAIYEFEIDSLEPLRRRIRPSPAQAIREFRLKHPDTMVISLPVKSGTKQFADAVPVRLSYYKNRKMNDLHVVYRLNADKTWDLKAPIPDRLP